MKFEIHEYAVESQYEDSPTTTTEDVINDFTQTLIRNILLHIVDVSIYYITTQLEYFQIRTPSSHRFTKESSLSSSAAFHTAVNKNISKVVK